MADKKPKVAIYREKIKNKKIRLVKNTDEQNKSSLCFWEAVVLWTWIPQERQTFCCAVAGPPSNHRHRTVQPLQGDFWRNLESAGGRWESWMELKELTFNLRPLQSPRNRLPRPDSTLGLQLLAHPGQWWGTGGQDQRALILTILERRTHLRPFSWGAGRKSSCVDNHTLCPGCWLDSG